MAAGPRNRVDTQTGPRMGMCQERASRWGFVKQGIARIGRPVAWTTVAAPRQLGLVSEVHCHTRPAHSMLVGLAVWQAVVAPDCSWSWLI